MFRGKISEDKLLKKLANLNEVQTVERSKVNDEQARKDGDIYIQGLMGYSDLLIDVDKDKYKEWCDEKSTKSKWDLAIEFRKHENGPRPLLIIYPITKDSNPAPHATKKVRLFDDLPEYQPHDIFGIGVVFPNVDNFNAQKFLQLDLINIQEEDTEEIDERELISEDT